MIGELKNNYNMDHYKDVFKRHGITDQHITNLTAFYTELNQADADQVNAMKDQKEATKARNISMKSLGRAMRSIRRDARIIVKDQPLVLIEFERMSRGRGPGGKDNPSPTPPAK